MNQLLQFSIQIATPTPVHFLVKLRFGLHIFEFISFQFHPGILPVASAIRLKAFCLTT